MPSYPLVSRAIRSRSTRSSTTTYPMSVAFSTHTTLPILHNISGFRKRCHSNHNTVAAAGFGDAGGVSVVISSSRDVFENLALEQLLLRERAGRCLFMWRDDPCVVIGKHQNPWLEVDLKQLRERGFVLARRASGGGAVFHDLGNLNLSFITARDEYCRAENLSFVQCALSKRFGKHVQLNDRDDLLFDGRKISGSASRLERTRAFHHLTLLLDSNLRDVQSLLTPSVGLDIQCKATKSVRSHVANLFHPSHPSPTDLEKQIGEEYLAGTSSTSKSMAVLDPGTIARVSETARDLRGWDWLYGLTPAFTCSIALRMERGDRIAVQIQTYHGRIRSCCLQTTRTNRTPHTSRLQSLLEKLSGVKFERQSILSALQELEANHVLKDCTDAVISLPII